MDLRPKILDDIGTVRAVREVLEDSASRYGYEADFMVVGKELSLSDGTEMAIFRIAQEAIRNVKKHARAVKVQIAITFGSDWVDLDVRDDGIGLEENPKDREDPAYHLGLVSMIERAEIMGGRLLVDSKPGKGTRIIAHIPVVHSPLS